MDISQGDKLICTKMEIQVICLLRKHRILDDLDDIIIEVVIEEVSAETELVM